MAGGSATSPTAATQPPSRSTILPRSVLAKLSGASEISFSRKCGDVAPVDVAGGDLGGDHVVVGERQVGAVVGEAPQTSEGARPVAPTRP